MSTPRSSNPPPQFTLEDFQAGIKHHRVNEVNQWELSLSKNALKTWAFPRKVKCNETGVKLIFPSLGKDMDIVAYNYGFEAMVEMELSEYKKHFDYHVLKFFCLIRAALLLGVNKTQMGQLYITDTDGTKRRILKHAWNGPDMRKEGWLKALYDRNDVVEMKCFGITSYCLLILMGEMSATGRRSTEQEVSWEPKDHAKSRIPSSMLPGRMPRYQYTEYSMERVLKMSCARAIEPTSDSQLLDIIDLSLRPKLAIKAKGNLSPIKSATVTRTPKSALLANPKSVFVAKSSPKSDATTPLPSKTIEGSRPLEIRRVTTEPQTPYNQEKPPGFDAMSTPSKKSKLQEKTLFVGCSSDSDLEDVHIPHTPVRSLSFGKRKLSEDDVPSPKRAKITYTKVVTHNFATSSNSKRVIEKPETEVLSQPTGVSPIWLDKLDEFCMGFFSDGHHDEEYWYDLRHEPNPKPWIDHDYSTDDDSDSDYEPNEEDLDFGVGGVDSQEPIKALLEPFEYIEEPVATWETMHTSGPEPFYHPVGYITVHGNNRQQHFELPNTLAAFLKEKKGILENWTDVQCSREEAMKDQHWVSVCEDRGYTETKTSVNADMKIRRDDSRLYSMTGIYGEHPHLFPSLSLQHINITAHIEHPASYNNSTKLRISTHSRGGRLLKREFAGTEGPISLRDLTDHNKYKSFQRIAGALVEVEVS